MGNAKKVEEHIEKLKKKNKKAERLKKIVLTCGAAACLSGVATAMIGGAGCAMDADVLKSHVGREVTSSATYQQSINKQIDQLCADLSAGKISYAEFKEQYEAIHGNYAGYNYAKDNNLVEYKEEVERVERSEKASKNSFLAGTGLVVSGIIGVGVACACKDSQEWRKRKIEELENSPFAQSSMGE